MESNQINEIVDKLADKVGIAVNKIAPIASEVVEQVSFKGRIIAGSCLSILCIITSIFVYLILYGLDEENQSITDRERENNYSIAVITVAIYIFTSIFLVTGMIKGLMMAIAPLPHILGV